VLREPRFADVEPQAADTVDWLLLDLNSYFASVEQELRPELRGKPIAVVPVVTDTTVCIAASYEAKAFGVKTGTRVSDAKRMCPGIVFVEGRHQLYVEMHHRIVGAVESCIPVASVLSIDEMACRLMGSERRIARAVEIAQAIKRAIKQQAGETLRCSIGLAPNRYLSKIASDMQKPDGLTVLLRDELPGSLAALKPMDLPGVGRRMNERLEQHGVSTMQQIIAMSPEEMYRVWGSVQGERLYHLLRGIDYDDLREEQKSIGHSHVLPPNMRSDEGAYAIVQKLVQKAGIRLRTMQFWAGAMELTIKYAPPPAKQPVANPKLGAFDIPDRPAARRFDPNAPNESFVKFTWHERQQMVECQDSVTLGEALRALWEKRPIDRARRENVRPYFVGVSLFELVPDNLHSLDLFGDSKRAQLTKAVDRINQKYGSQTLYFASMHLAREAAPTRIAFQSIPDLF
jgi:DNA polymerase IV